MSVGARERTLAEALDHHAQLLSEKAPDWKVSSMSRERLPTLVWRGKVITAPLSLGLWRVTCVNSTGRVATGEDRDLDVAMLYAIAEAVAQERDRHGA